MITLWVGAALAREPEACATAEQPPAGGSMSVAWVSPIGKRAGNHAFLAVVPSVELRRAVAEDPTSVARMLQRLGLRRSDREPRRRYKVVVFDAHTDDLTGCGFTTDLETEGRGLPLYGSTWSALAADGFCVLPADRFVAGGAR